jgi:DNA-binding GntR family transcriptional regulator
MQAYVRPEGLHDATKREVQMRQQGKTNKISKDTLRKTVKQYIQKQINDGVYKPGDRVVETRLAKELNISQAPVREAMLELSLMGFLEERPYSGSFVKKLEIDEVEDVFNTRAFLEEYAAKKAAERRTKEDLAAMTGVIDKMEHCKSTEEFVDLDNEFHRMVINAAKSKSLKRAWEGLQFSEWTYESVLATRYTLQELCDSHVKLLECIRAGADHTAGASMFLHIKGFSDDMLEHMREKEAGKTQKRVVV